MYDGNIPKKDSGGQKGILPTTFINGTGCFFVDLEGKRKKLAKVLDFPFKIWHNIFCWLVTNMRV